MRIFFDMDGTLAHWKCGATIEELSTPGYFRDLEKYENMVVLLLKLALCATNVNVAVLSCVLGPQQLAEKEEWISKHLLDSVPSIFVPCGQSKAKYVGAISKEDVLIDDHTPNLLAWERAGGTGIKVLNGINGINKKWRGKEITVLDDFSKLSLEDFVTFCGNQQNVLQNSLASNVTFVNTYYSLLSMNKCMANVLAPMMEVEDTDEISLFELMGVFETAYGAWLKQAELQAEIGAIVLNKVLHKEISLEEAIKLTPGELLSMQA